MENTQYQPQAPQPASEASAAESSQQAAPQQPAEAEVPREYKSALAKAKNRRSPIRFSIAADCRCDSPCWRG